MRTPEPSAKRPARKPETGFYREFAHRIQESLVIPELYPGRLIVVESPGLRRKLRGVSSGRNEMTDASLLLAGLALLRPDMLVDSGKVVIEDRRVLARFRKTWSASEQRKTWSILNATRLMTVFESVARQYGWRCMWITEGLDTTEIQYQLAIPDDHLFLGFLAVETHLEQVDLAPDTIEPSPFLDRNGFFGQWPKHTQESLAGSSGAG